MGVHFLKCKKGSNSVQRRESIQFNMALRPFVTVHAGAGFHSVAKEADYVAICKAACERGLSVLASNVPALDAVVAVMMCLENATCTNAGTGSNLTLYGTVECDASVMDGRTTAFGAVGAVPGIKNPVCLAKRLIEVQAEGLSLGRIPPSLLVGQGALDWAIQQGFSSVAGNELVTESSDKTYRKYKKRLLRLHFDQESRKACKSIKAPSSWQEDTTQTFHNDIFCSSRHVAVDEAGNPKRQKVNSLLSEDDEVSFGPLQSTPSVNPQEKLLPNHLRSENFLSDRPIDCSTTDDSNTDRGNFSLEANLSKHLDTVGAMCVDSHGNIACAVSSGGIALKQPGRLGSAASFGAGCWALNQNVNTPGIGVVTSGTGEHLIRTNFAKEFADCILSEKDTTMAVNMAFDLKFFGSPLLKDVKQKYAGTLLVKQKTLNQIELVWSYCTASMCVGYGVGGHEPTAFISRLADSQIPGKSLHVQGIHFCL